MDHYSNVAAATDSSTAALFTTELDYKLWNAVKITSEVIIKMEKKSRKQMCASQSQYDK